MKSAELTQLKHVQIYILVQNSKAVITTSFWLRLVVYIDWRRPAVHLSPSQLTRCSNFSLPVSLQALPVHSLSWLLQPQLIGSCVEQSSMCGLMGSCVEQSSMCGLSPLGCHHDESFCSMTPSLCCQSQPCQNPNSVAAARPLNASLVRQACSLVLKHYPSHSMPQLPGRVLLKCNLS